MTALVFRRWGSVEQIEQDRVLALTFDACGLTSLVVGCCGTAPAHITAVTAAVRPFAPRPLSPAGVVHV